MTKPRYRDDIKGQVTALMADCQASMAGELAHSDDFIFQADDTQTWSEYADYLTSEEMRRCFVRAQREGVAA